MDRYLIQSPHTAEECKQAVKDFNAAGYLHHFEWGCDDNVHEAWAILEAESHEHARQIVPWEFRSRAHIVRLVKYEIAESLHSKKKA